MSYIAYLRSIEEAEEAEDVACFDTRRDEPTVSLEQVVENYRKKYGLYNGRTAALNSKEGQLIAYELENTE